MNVLREVDYNDQRFTEVLRTTLMVAIHLSTVLCSRRKRQRGQYPTSLLGCASGSVDLSLSFRIITKWRQQTCVLITPLTVCPTRRLISKRYFLHFVSNSHPHFQKKKVNSLQYPARLCTLGHILDIHRRRAGMPVKFNFYDARCGNDDSEGEEAFGCSSLLAMPWCHGIELDDGKGSLIGPQRSTT